MARYRTKHTHEASAALASGVQFAEYELPKPDSGDHGEGWLAWIIAHAFVKEARALPEGSSAPVAKQALRK